MPYAIVATAEHLHSGSSHRPEDQITEKEG